MQLLSTIVCHSDIDKNIFEQEDIIS